MAAVYTGRACASFGASFRRGECVVPAGSAVNDVAPVRSTVHDVSVTPSKSIARAIYSASAYPLQLLCQQLLMLDLP